MFRKNDDHKQLELFNATTGMDERIRRRLENSWAPLFYEHVFCQINEEPFSVLYSENWGRPNFPVNILVGLEIIKHFRDSTDEELLEDFYFNIQVKWALGIRDIGECPVAERTLYEFRQRLYTYALEHRGQDDLIYQQFQSISQHFADFLHLSTEEMRMDSTQIMSNIRRAGRLSLAYDVLYQAVKACPVEILSTELMEVTKPEFKINLLYRVKAREISGRLHELLQLCAELTVVASNNKDLEQREELQLLARFLLEQAEYDSETKSWAAKKNQKGKTSNNLQSAYDPDATCRKKGDEVHVGYVANLAETCADENPVQIVTDYTFEKNNVADTTMAHESIPRLSKTYGTKELYVDGGYSGEEVHNTASVNNVSMYYTNMTGKESSKIPISDFTFEEDKVTHCPAGHPSELSFHNPENGKILAHFNIEVCNKCKAKHSCPTQPKRQAATITISRKQRIAAETRKQILDKDQHRINTSKRAATEGTNSAMKRAHGADKLAVRGENKCRTVFGLKTLAHNFKQLVRCVRGDIRRSLQDAARRHRREQLLASQSA